MLRASFREPLPVKRERNLGEARNNHNHNNDDYDDEDKNNDNDNDNSNNGDNLSKEYIVCTAPV